MTAANVNSWVQQLGLEGRRAPEFIRDREEIGSSDRLLPQANTMRRAWDEMNLDGMLCLDGIPTVYFKEFSRANQPTIRELQRQLWNQSIAPLLVLVFPSNIHVYSGLALPAEEEEDVSSGNRLVALFDRVADVLELRQFMREVELGEVFRRYAPSFDPGLRVDQHLLGNLNAARELLLAATPSKPDVKIIHALLGRVVFACYLTDRKIIQSSYFTEAGSHGCSNLRGILQTHSPSVARKLLYNLFHKLQADFNGDIFDDDLVTESRLINDRHIEILGRFLNGDNLATGQMSLGFWAYDFSIIPIETISSIYEQFLGAEDEEDKQESGAYYTPRFLAELVLDLLIDVEQPLLSKRFLDPACGSGIFLVGIFNRLAEEWNRKVGKATNIKRAEALTDIIRRSLFGIDRNETACRIAAFSLYLALLDHLSPRDIQKLQAKGKFLPKLVAYRRDPNAVDVACNIICGDFFEEQLPLLSNHTDLPQDGFDYIVGNPPWVRVTDKKSFVSRWCQSRNLEIPQGQSACAFVLKAPEHLRKEGRICFVLPASILLNHQDKSLRFQQRWLSKFRVERVVNLSDMSYFLFASADRPATIVK
ncbi:MAG: HsdM family class I SAM-dependent methyltransferase, partial [Blastocatellia bacterium]